MSALLRLLRVIALLLFVLVVAVPAYLFFTANTAPLSLVFMDWHTPELASWIWLLAALTVGYLLGVVSMLGLNVRLAWRARSADRRRRRAEAAVHSGDTLDVSAAQVSS